MKPFSLVGALSLALAACAPARTTVSPAPAPVSAPSVGTPPAAAPPSTLRLTEPPRNWHLLDQAADGVPGISAERALRELLAGRTPARQVVVAVIDGGTDTAHVDLRANLWTNAREVAGNGRDDDGNGYTDDVRGWSFIGGRDGRDVHHDTYEVTREYVRCTTGPAATRPPAERCSAIERDFMARKAGAEAQLPQYRNMSAVLGQAVTILQRAVGSDSLTVGAVTALQPTQRDVQQARQLYLQLAASGISPADLTEARVALESQVNFGLNPQYDPRGIVGDDYGNLTERVYGNANVVGPEAGHGTHVAGIIGAVRGNGVGVDGIAPDVRLMILRAVPDGDERDKDVANAIRYAADNGAHVINMSFGKSYSPGKSAVDEAVKHAESKGVLLVHAAGNEGADLARSSNFPTPRFLDGGRAANWIEVGASSWKGADSLVAGFSNYGRELVDVFAPGVDIFSTVPNGRYDTESGTSMAAPVVSGLAAMLMSYFPTLTAADVKRVILASATRRADQRVALPGSGEPVAFGTLSSTGGIVNAYAAVRMAQELSATKQ
jgi:subtilisin family serine protease